MSLAAWHPGGQRQTWALFGAKASLPLILPRQHLWLVRAQTCLDSMSLVPDGSDLGSGWSTSSVWVALLVIPQIGA